LVDPHCPRSFWTRASWCLHERGFSAAGVREIMQLSNAPLGSITSHFQSKESFALAVLDRYSIAFRSSTSQTTCGNLVQRR